MMKMAHRNYSLIPVVAAIILIPQLFFWWLAPVAAAARLAVYIGGTVLTVAIPAAYLATYYNSNLRKAAGLAVICFVLEIAVVVLCVLLLALDVSVRSAVFALVITTLVCLIALIPMINAVLKQQRQGVYSDAIAVEPMQPSNQPFRAAQDPGDCAAGLQPHSPIPARMPYQAAAGKPLPPRNR